MHLHHGYSAVVPKQILKLRSSLALTEGLEAAPLVGMIKLRALFFYSISISLKVPHQPSLVSDAFHTICYRDQQ